MNNRCRRLWMARRFGRRASDLRLAHLARCQFATRDSVWLWRRHSTAVRLFGEEIIHWHVERRRDAVNRADGWIGFARLNLAEHTGAHLGAACQLAQTHLPFLADGSQFFTDNTRVIPIRFWHLARPPRFVNQLL